MAATLCVQASLAGSYDDFTTGVTAFVRNDPDTAIAAFSAALTAGDLAAVYVPAAYRMRGSAYLKKKMCKEALADVNASAALAPLDNAGLALRASIKNCLNDPVGMKQDVEAMRGPPDTDLYFALARVQWRNDNFDGAYESLTKAADQLAAVTNSDASYLLIWYAMTAGRIGKFDTNKFETYVDFVKSKGWPKPIIDLYRGEISPENVRPAAQAGDAKRYSEQSCELDYYVGEWRLNHGQIDLAKPLIARAAGTCPKTFMEYDGAQAEARRLGLSLEAAP